MIWWRARRRAVESGVFGAAIDHRFSVGTKAPEAEAPAFRDVNFFEYCRVPIHDPRR